MAVNRINSMQPIAGLEREPSVKNNSLGRGIQGQPRNLSVYLMANQNFLLQERGGEVSPESEDAHAAS